MIIFYKYNNGFTGSQFSSIYKLFLQLIIKHKTKKNVGTQDNDTLSLSISFSTSFAINSCAPFKTDKIFKKASILLNTKHKHCPR